MQESTILENTGKFLQEGKSPPLVWFNESSVLKVFAKHKSGDTKSGMFKLECLGPTSVIQKWVIQFLPMNPSTFLRVK